MPPARHESAAAAHVDKALALALAGKLEDEEILRKLELHK
jgi:hypothetical protein